MFPPSRKMFVDNEWVAASNGATYAVPNPATEEAIGTAPEATVEDMRRAIAAARRAFDEGPWPRSSRQERARVITAIADGMERRKEELRQMLIAEAGATYLTHDIQLEQPIRLLRNYADLALTFDFEEALPVRVTDGPLGTFVCSSIVHRQPAGVCGLIPTWNFPLFVTVQKLGPALATGCTMVFKPSPYGPLVNLMLAEIVADADLPPGVVNFVTGQSNAIAETLVTDPRIDKVSFTGSVATGKKIMAAAAATLQGVHRERRQTIAEYIEWGKRDGAVLAHGAGRPKELPRGYFLEPTIFCGVQNHIRIAQEEIFGPVVAVLPFRDPDEAIRIANDSTYGLGGMIFSRDTVRALELAKRIRTGAVWISNGINLIDAPFGGFKESGIGREGGRFGMEEYTELQQISWRA